MKNKIKMEKSQKQEKSETRNHMPEESIKKWTVKDTMFLYPTLTPQEAQMAWEMGW